MEKIYPFTILDVAGILDLKVRRRQPTNMDVDCPFCNHKKGKMNINLVKNVFRCNYCETSGGMIDLYAKLHGINQKQAFAEICEILHCGKKAPEYQTLAAKQKNMVPELEQVEKADLETRDQTYRMLLSQLILTASHKQNLLERGLRVDEIVKYQYRSTPAFGFHKIVSALVASGCQLSSVPGFYTRKDNTYGIQFHKKASGILIPVCALDGHVEGFQIRLDHPIEDKKYIWFSSSNQFRGASIGGPVHFIGNPAAKTVYVTEGALKANVAHGLSGRTFLAVAGVTHYEALRPAFAQLRENGTTDIIEAYDMDKETNPHVQRACMNMIRIANEYGFQVHRLKWDERYKGIDDWLKHQQVIKTMR